MTKRSVDFLSIMGVSSRTISCPWQWNDSCSCPVSYIISSPQTIESQTNIQKCQALTLFIKFDTIWAPMFPRPINPIFLPPAVDMHLAKLIIWMFCLNTGENTKVRKAIFTEQLTDRFQTTKFNQRNSSEWSWVRAPRLIPPRVSYDISRIVGKIELHAPTKTWRRS